MQWCAGKGFGVFLRVSGAGTGRLLQVLVQWQDGEGEHGQQDRHYQQAVEHLHTG